MLREGFPGWDGDSDERLQSAGGMFDRHGRVLVKAMRAPGTRAPEEHTEVSE